MTAAFPGFIWGWFQVPDYEGSITFSQIVIAYEFPLLGVLVASGLFLVLKRFLTAKKLIAIFSALAVSCYYWYRLPALIGFGIFPNDGMLIDLSHSIPKWVVSVIIITTSLFFFWWIVFRKQKQISWGSRPAYAKISRTKTSLP
ncbi:hypothetical protein [Flagellimonas nanhaiensis]|nr:hypothetical protein [Allomuricauda nanhaiensis]